jgi:hypothetical protein
MISFENQLHIPICVALNHNSHEFYISLLLRSPEKIPGSPLLKAPGGRRSGSQTGLGSLAGRVEGGVRMGMDLRDIKGH